MTLNQWAAFSIPSLAMGRQEIQEAQTYLQQAQAALDDAELGAARTFVDLATPKVRRRVRVVDQGHEGNRAYLRTKDEAWHPRAASLWLQGNLLVRRIDRYSGRPRRDLGIPAYRDREAEALREESMGWTVAARFQHNDFWKAVSLAKDNASIVALAQLEPWLDMSRYDLSKVKELQLLLLSDLFRKPEAAPVAVQGLLHCAARSLDLGERKRATALTDLAYERAGEVADTTVMSWVDRWQVFLYMQPGFGGKPASEIDVLLERLKEDDRTTRLQSIFDIFLTAQLELFRGKSGLALEIFQAGLDAAEDAGLGMLVQGAGMGGTAAFCFGLAT